MHTTVADLAQHIQGRVIGDGSQVISGVADLRTAQAQHLSFLANPKYQDLVLKTKAGAVLVREQIPDAPCTLIVTANPYLALAQLATRLHPPRPWKAGIHPTAHVDSSAEVHATAVIEACAIVEAGAQVGAGTRVGAGCYVGHGARLGNQCVMHPGSKLMEGCVTGDQVILQPGAVIGSDGFGYAPDAQGHRHKIPQIGIVELGHDVEIGSNSTVDRATFGVTRIGDGCKIDNLVQIGHNVVLGQHCVIVSQSGIAGSTRLGDRVIIGAQGGLVGHITITSDVLLGARAGVIQSIEQPGTYSGYPAMPHRTWLRVLASQQHLPECRQRIRSMETKLTVLEERLAAAQPSS